MEINLWKDQWIGQKPALPLRSVLRESSINHRLFSDTTLVADLLQNQGREWNVPLLQSFITEETIKDIRMISPGGAATLDSYTWDFTKSGIYSVKSGYWVQNREVIGKPFNNPQPSLDNLYQEVWKMESAPKVKHFMWKCVNNSLPVLDNLAHRHLSKDTSCPRCPSQKETINHLIFKCPIARLIWAVSPIPAPRDGEWSESIYVNIHRILNLKNEQKEWEALESLAPWLVWRIWKNRNELVFKGKEFDALQVIGKAQEDAEEWLKRKCTSPITPPLPRRQRQEVKWVNPPDGWLKCNSDGAWSKDHEKSGLGWVLRNQEGRVMWMGIQATTKLRNVWETEAAALRWALLTITRFGFNKVIFEIDSEDLRTRIMEGSSAPHPLIQDIRTMLSNVSNGSLAFTYREGNSVADSLAKHARSTAPLEPMLYTLVPQWVKHLVYKDSCNNFMV